MKKKLFLISIIFLSLNFISFAENISVENEELKKSAQILSDLRRFEVITLGSIPFVTMDVSLVYSAINPDIAISPFLSLKYEPSAVDLSASQKWSEFWDSDCGKVIIYTAIASVSVGITDYVFNVIKRTNLNKKKNSNKNIKITDLENDPDATRLNLPEKKEKN